MCHMENCVYVNNSSVRLAAPSKTGANHSHAGDLIWLISNVIEPMNDSTVIVIVVSLEGEEAVDVSNVHTMHAFKFWVSNDKHAVITGTLLPPSWHGMDVFMPHATSATEITWGIEH